MSVNAESTADACNNAVVHVADTGSKVIRAVGSWAMRKPGVETMVEAEPTTIKIHDPIKRWHNRITPGMIVENLDILLGLNPGFIHRFSPMFNKWRTVGFERYTYTYGERLQNFRGINQLSNIINKLIISKSTRQAYMTIWDPADVQNDTVPCNIGIHFVVSNHDELSLRVFCRSQDVLRGLVLDTFCFSHMLEQVALETYLKVGDLYHIESNLHIYLKDLDKDPIIHFVSSKWYCHKINDLGPAELLTSQLKRKIYTALEHLAQSYEKNQKVTATELSKDTPYWNNYMSLLAENLNERKVS